MTNYEEEHQESLYNPQSLEESRDALVKLIQESGLIEADGNVGMVVGQLIQKATWGARKYAKNEFKQQLLGLAEAQDKSGRIEIKNS